MNTNKSFILIVIALFFISIVSAQTIITEHGIIADDYMNSSIFNGQWNGSFQYMLASQWNATNGSYLTTELNWNANYSQFLTNNLSITNALATKLGISQWNATNTSYLTSSALTPYLLISNWNSTNSSYLISSSLTPYLLISNWNSTNSSYLTSSSLSPYLLISNWNSTNTSYLTSTGNIGNWTLDKSTYTLLTTLNNGSYLNYPWNSTNSSYLTSSSLTPYLLISNWNATNTSYLTSTGNIGNWTLDKSTYTLLSVLNNGSYLNTAYGDTWINSTIDSKILVQNNSIVNWVTSTFTSLANTMTALGNWSADKVNYATLNVLNNGSYKNVAETDSLAYNGTLIDNSRLNNGSYLNPSEYETKWNANYSQFLTNNISNTNYVSNVNTSLLAIINNGSYLNPASTDTFIANYSTFLTHITFGTLSNGTLWSWMMNGTLFKTSQWNATNTSYLTAETDSKAYNGTLVPTSILMNGSFFNPATTDTFIANYSQFLLNNQSLTNYIGSNNVSINNYIALQNNSILNWISSVFNVTVNNEIARQNTSLVNYINLQNTSQTNFDNVQNTSVTNALATKLGLAGGIMTGNLNISTTTITSQGSATYSTNSTCAIIKGATGSLYVC
jgi:hypothetical protein